MAGNFENNERGGPRQELSEDELLQLKMFDFGTFGKLEEDKIKKKQDVELKELKTRISSELANKLKKKKLFGTTDEREIEWVRSTIGDIIKYSHTELPITIQKKLIEEMVLEITSLGKIHPLVMDKSVSEIMINAADEVWVEKSGKLHLTDIKFNNDEEILELANKIASSVRRSVNNSNPIVDARLPDGSRVNIVIHPVTMKGTTITIRKHFKEKLTISDLIKFGSINEEAAKFLENAVKARSNIIVSGGTGSGKTTNLNIFSNFVPDEERIITLEDSAELQLSNSHVVKMESRVANAEGKGEITIRDLVKTSLRMSPHRIIVGEVRDGTAFDLLQSMNTGHDGSMATVHSNDPEGCISRLESLVLMAGTAMPTQAIRKNIASALDIIVQIAKLSDGSRKITHISEVADYDEKNDMVVINDIYRFKKTGVDENGKFRGKLVFTGHIVNKYLLEKFDMNNLSYHESVGLEKPKENFEFED